MRTVKEIMTRNVLTVAPDAYVEDAAWGLTVRGIGGAPVKDAQGHVLGVVSKADLVDPARHALANGHVTVEQVMTPALFAAKTSDTVLEAARRMVDTGTHRLVVVDDEGHMAGIITTMDVLKAFVHGEI